MAAERVELWIYDLSNGLAAALSPALLGPAHAIAGVWHSSVVVAGQEIFFGRGISVAPAGATPFGRPVERLLLGETRLPLEVREALLVELSAKWTPEAYDLLENNCNNFADEYATLLCGRGVPPHITGLPAAVLASPFGAALRPLLAGLERQLGAACAGAAPAPAAAGPPPAAAAPAPAPAPAAPAIAPGGEEPDATTAARLEEEIDAAVAEAAMADLAAASAEPGPVQGAAPAAGEERLGAGAGARRRIEAEVAAEYERLTREGLPPRAAEAGAAARVAARRRAGGAATARAARPGAAV
jgi:hypothetical protein